MENKKDKKGSIDPHIKELSDKIFLPIADEFVKKRDSLKETPSNHTMVDKPQKLNKKTVTPSLYNPHNYRLYFQFTKEQYTPKQGMVGVWFGKLINYGKEFTALGEGTRITVRKTQVEVINKLTEEQWYSINRSKAKEEIYAICNKIDEKCINSLKKFIEIYGGKSDFTILKRECRGLYNNLHTKSDNKVMQEPFIDKLPLDMTFETDIVKKVYKKPNVEFKEPIYASNYLENSALREFAPEIANSIGALDKKLTPAIEALSKQIELHLKVERSELETNQERLKTDKEMQKTLKAIQYNLPKKKPTKKPKKEPQKCYRDWVREVFDV